MGLDYPPPGQSWTALGHASTQYTHYTLLMNWHCGSPGQVSWLNCSVQKNFLPLGKFLPKIQNLKLKMGNYRAKIDILSTQIYAIRNLQLTQSWNICPNPSNWRQCRVTKFLSDGVISVRHAGCNNNLLQQYPKVSVLKDQNWGNSIETDYIINALYMCIN